MYARLLRQITREADIPVRICLDDIRVHRCRILWFGLLRERSCTTPTPATSTNGGQAALSAAANKIYCLPTRGTSFHEAYSSNLGYLVT